MYSVGNRLKISLFGKSHAKCIGVIMEGVPSGMVVDTGFLASQMALRRPSDGIGTPRKEADEVVFENGLTDGRTDGKPLLMTIYNKDTDSSSYSKFNETPRPGHADLPALFKFKDYDVSGGAQFSGRMTAPLVAAGSIAKQFLLSKGIEVHAFTRSIHDVKDESERSISEIAGSVDFKTRAADADMDSRMIGAIMFAKERKDSVGGVIECVVTGLPIGLGGDWFDALDVSIARAVFSVPAVKGVEFGKGFAITEMYGSQSNDGYRYSNGKIVTFTNNMGGVVGGMSDGMPLVFRAAIKPTPSIGIEQNTVNLKKECDDRVTVDGRHDPCIVPRAVSVIEAMAAITVMDQILTFGSF